MQTRERVQTISERSSPRAKNLWNEMVASLERGRSSASKAKGEYARAYFELQRENAFLSTEEKQICLRQMYALWKLIPRAMQEEIADRSPERVLTELGIAESEE